jgi:two-component system, OmpR family, sensor histidine kinase VicK
LTISYNDGSSGKERTEVVYGLENVMNIILQFLSKANRIDSCGDSKAPQIAIEVEEYRKLLIDLKKREIKVRYITDITKGNIKYCKELMNFFEEIRHLDGIKANFSVSKKEYLASAALSQKKEIEQQQQQQSKGLVQQVIYSNVNDIIEQQKYVFDSFWNKAIPAEQRIKKIEQGITLGTTEVIQIPSRTQELFIDLVKSAKQELLLILPTTNSFLRENRLGIIQLLKQASAEHNVNVRLLTPTDDNIQKMVQDMMIVRTEQKQSSSSEHFDIQTINPSSEAAVSTVTIVVADRKISLVIEKKDDLKENFIDAIGLATYSTSKPTVSSYVSIFENLWTQAELYQQIALANEQLKIHDRMQREFINIASHEMKTPTQSILGYSQLLQQHPEKREEMTQAIFRNAIRLQKLTNDILEVTRIESQSLKLNIEQFNLNDLISNIVQDYTTKLEKDNSNVNLLYNQSKAKSKSITIQADKARITQVISNLISNAVKFTTTKEGRSITINVEKEEEQQQKGEQQGNTNNNYQVIVSVKDTGEGIDPEILPRLFTKFATKSEAGGTGLGLFISKSIIEAHGGRIWAENNPNGKGATFYFSLPLSKEHQQQKLPD